MSERLVTLITYPTAPQAEIAKLALEDADFHVSLEDAHIVTADWFLGYAVGQVKIKVPESQAEEALKFLQEHPLIMGIKTEEPREVEGQESHRCLACGAPMSERADSCRECGWTFIDAEGQLPEESEG